MTDHIAICAGGKLTAVMQRRIEPHDSLEFFPTPPWATRALCEYIRQVDPELAEKRVWEPACGEGHMARPLSEYFELVYGSDVAPYGFGSVRDFLFPGDEPEFDWIITNPPFRLADQFANTMIDRAREGCAILVRTSFLEGIGRYGDLFSRRKPSAILQFTERVPMHKGRLDPKGVTATSYCWIVWRCRPHKPDAMSMPIFVWIPPCRKKLERAQDYELDSPIPEPAEGDNPDHNVVGGVLIPSIAAEQSEEFEAEEAVTASASTVLPPALLVPGEPASVRGPARRAPPEFHSDDEVGLRQALAAMAAGVVLDWSVVRELIAMGYVNATATRPVITDTGRVFLNPPETADEKMGEVAGACSDFVTRSEPDGTPRKPGVTAGETAPDLETAPFGFDVGAATPDSQSASSSAPAGCASPGADGFPDLPQFLRRRPAQGAAV